METEKLDTGAVQLSTPLTDKNGTLVNFILLK